MKRQFVGCYPPVVAGGSLNVFLPACAGGDHSNLLTTEVSFTARQVHPETSMESHSRDVSSLDRIPMNSQHALGDANRKYNREEQIMNRTKLWALGLTVIMLMGGAIQPSAFAQRGGRGWGGGVGGVGLGIGNRGGFYGGYSPGYGVNIGVGNGYRGYGYGSPGYYGSYGYPGYGYGRGYGYGGYGGYGNYGSYYNQPSYYNNSQPIYSDPGYAQPAVPMSQPATYDGGEIVLFTSPDTAGDVQFTLNGTPYQLKPGEVQRLTNDRQWTIEYAGSNGQPVQRFTLSTGRYKFKPTGNGISLFSTQDQPGIGQQANGPAPVPAVN